MDPTLQNTSVQGLTAAGKTWLSNTSITGQTDINVTGTATTTIGNSGGLVVVAGNASLRNVSAQALTVGPLWAGATNVTSLIATGNTSVQNVSAQALTVGPLWAGATTLASSSVTGNETITGTLGVTGLTTLSGGATVTGTTTQLNSTTTTVGGTLGVTGEATLSGGVKTSTLSSATGTTLSISSESLMARSVDIATNATAGAIQIGSGATTTTLFGTVNIGLSSAGTTTIKGSFQVDKPINLGYTTVPTFTSTQIGYSIKYDFSTNGSVNPGSSYTVAAFTNTPIGVYLLAVGPFTVFSFEPTDRFDLINVTATNITFVSSSGGMEFGGNGLGKFGVCYSTPIKVTSATNDLNVQLKNDTGSSTGISVLAGSSALIRIA
jgi:hypothetical protein